MNKRMVSILLAGIMAASLLVGCGGSGDSAATGTSEAAATADVASEDAHTLSVYAWDANFNIPAIEAAAADYKANVDPDFTLNLIEQSQSADIETAVTTAGSSGDYSNLPDIVLFQDHYIQRYVADYPGAWNALEDTGIDWSDFGAEKVSYSTIDGIHYGVPVDNGTVIFAYRTDLLEQAGYTIDDVTGISWDEWIEVGADVYNTTGKYLCSIYGSGNDMPYMMLQAEGESMFKDGQPQLTSDSVKAVTDVLVRAVQANALYLANDGSEYTDQTIIGDMVAGIMQGNWIIPTIEQVAENSGKWEITTMPTLEGNGKEGYASNGGASLYITSNCKNVELARDFLAKTFGAGSQSTYDAALTNGGVITCSSKAAESTVYNEGVDYFGGQAIYADIVEMGTHVQVVEQNDYHYTALNLLSAATQNIINGTDIDDALADAQEQLTFAMGQ